MHPIPVRTMNFKVPDVADFHPLYIAGSAAGPQDANGLRTDVLVSFEPTPGTVAFFGYGASLAKDPLLYPDAGYTRTTDGFFVKVAYVFRR